MEIPKSHGLQQLVVHEVVMRLIHLMYGLKLVVVMLTIMIYPGPLLHKLLLSKSHTQSVDILPAQVLLH